MHLYRIVLDAYDSRSNARGARVVTYSRGYNRADALSRIGRVAIARNGRVNDGLSAWLGADKMPDGPYEVRGLPEWDMVSMRTVKHPGVARVLWETETVSETIARQEREAREARERDMVAQSTRTTERYISGR